MCEINCENFLCIYQKNNKCILNEISLDNLGICGQSIYVDIEKEKLDIMKMEMLDYYDMLDKK